MFFKAVLYGLLVGSLLPGILGCAEGPLWKTGYLSPWVRQKWQDEEQIAATMFSRRSDLRTQVDKSLASDTEAQQQMAIRLGEIVTGDPVVLMRVEATRLLGELPVSAAADGLKVAMRDKEVTVREVAVRALGNRTDDVAAQLLANMSRSDDNLDVRIAATSELGKFKGDIPLAALGEALSHSNPAMQLSAAGALQRSTGKDLGNDIQEWQRYIEKRQVMPEESESIAQENPTNDFIR